MPSVALPTLTSEHLSLLKDFFKHPAWALVEDQVDGVVSALQQVTIADTRNMDKGIELLRYNIGKQDGATQILNLLRGLEEDARAYKDGA